jgi:DNA-binding MarR family transcriptional regulator
MDDDLGLVDAVVQLSFAVHEILTAIAADFDLSITQVRMLGILRDREPGMLELAQFLCLEKSSVTGLVDRAEARGLVERTRGAGDGRAVHVRMTARGQELAGQFLARLEPQISELVAGLPARERAQLVRSAGRVVAERQLRR